jgi:glucan biosynthesis protein C
MKFGGVIIWALPIAIITALLKPHSLGVQNIVNDLAMFFFYLMVFLAGFIISEKEFWRYFENKITPLIAGTILLTAMVYVVRWQFPQMQKGEPVYFGYSVIKALNGWLWILMLLTLGKRYLNKPGKFLPLMTESVYPIYILHQTIIICLGYYIIKTGWPIGLKFLSIVFGTIIICWALFMVVRLNRVTRILFGLHSKIEKSPKVCKSKSIF